MIGLAEGALNATIPYLRERSQFNTKIGDFQVLSYIMSYIHYTLIGYETFESNTCY